jgi:hypothetical protein
MTYPRCPRCRLWVREDPIFELDGCYYHEWCYASEIEERIPLICHACGSGIEADEEAKVSRDGWVYHDTCYIEDDDRPTDLLDSSYKDVEDDGEDGLDIDDANNDDLIRDSDDFDDKGQG